MKYLDKLKKEKRATISTDKTDKSPFVSNVSTEDGHFSENIPLSLPFFDADGSLVIPFNCDPKYHWWSGGQVASKTEEEIKTWLH